MSIRVGLNGRVADSELDRIRKVAGIEIDDLTGLTRRAAARGPEAAEDAKSAESELDARLSELEALITWQPIPRLAARAPRLKWVQSFWAGVDALEPTGIFESGAVITTGRGVTSPAIAEWVIAAIYALSKRFPNYDSFKTEKRWTRLPAGKVFGSTCCIVGLGAIGQATAALATAAGMRVLGLRRTPDGPTVLNVEHVYGPADLDHVAFGERACIGLFVDDVTATRTALGDTGIVLLDEIEEDATEAWFHYRAPDGSVQEVIGPRQG